MAMDGLKRRSRSLPELSSPPPWFELSFLLDFAEEADMFRDSTVTSPVPGVARLCAVPISLKNFT